MLVFITKKTLSALALALIVLAGTARAEAPLTVVPEGYRAVIGVKKEFAFTVDKNSPILRPGAELPTDENAVVRLVPCGKRDFMTSAISHTSDGSAIDVHFKGTLIISCDNHSLLRSLARDTFGKTITDVLEVYSLRNGKISHAIAKTASAATLASVQADPDAFAAAVETAIRTAAKASEGIEDVALTELRLH